MHARLECMIHVKAFGKIENNVCMSVVLILRKYIFVLCYISDIFIFW